jgi:hypothetical protein
MFQRNKWIIFMLIGLVLGTLNMPVSRAADTVTLEWWTVNSEEYSEQVQRDMAKQFETENPGIKVNVTVLPESGFTDKMTTTLGAGKGAPDVAFFWDNNWFPQARAWLAAKYGYDKFPGACHVVPNHGVMILSLLYGEDVFQKTLMIANTCGWDTDCNSGNVGCLMGIKNGLAGIDAGPGWRGPLADRLYISSADGGRAITDAAIETYHIVNSGRALKNLPPIFPKGGARLHFDLPGAVQGFTVRVGTAQLENVVDHSESGGRSLAIHYQAALEQPVCVASPTFIPPEAMNMRGYTLLACPTLYPGQTLRARIEADTADGNPITCTLFAHVYGPQDTLYREAGPSSDLASGTEHIFEWRLPETNGSPIAEIGLELSAQSRANGTLYLDYLSWGGSPDMLLTRAEGTMWKCAWVEGISRLRETASAPFHVVQNEGTGLLIQGTRDWTNYQVSAQITPHLCKAAGIAARVQGMMRYYALLLGEKSRPP